MSNQRKTPVSAQVSDEITLRDILENLRALLSHWPILLVSACLGLAVAFVFNRYTADTYKVVTTVAVEEVENPLASSIDGMLNLGLAFGSKGIVDTRIAVLKSYSHNLRVARKLGWGVVLFNQGRLNKREVYNPGHLQLSLMRTTTNCWVRNLGWPSNKTPFDSPLNKKMRSCWLITFKVTMRKKR